jgi:hypothetical protein
MAFRTLTRWYGKLFNRRVSERLRISPAGALSRSHLLLTMTGHRSGRTFTIPVNYRRTSPGPLVISTEANWWRNCAVCTPLQVFLDGKHQTGVGCAILNDHEKRKRLGRLLAGMTWPVFSKSLVVIEIRLDADKP